MLKKMGEGYIIAADILYKERYWLVLTVVVLFCSYVDC